MGKKARIEAIERRVEELEARRELTPDQILRFVGRVLSDAAEEDDL